MRISQVTKSVSDYIKETGIELDHYNRVTDKQLRDSKRVAITLDS